MPCSSFFGATSFALAAALVALGCYALVRKLLGSRIAADSEKFSSGMIAPESATWTESQHIDRELRDLRPANDYQRGLRDQMLVDWDIVSELRQKLEAAA